ncbi:hypothetical protein HDU86_004802 [Geranomyces michiganensis]|nr:hypothetical protein HDU86_004802 [Geranomyces michiganensis]
MQLGPSIATKEPEARPASWNILAKAFDTKKFARLSLKENHRVPNATLDLMPGKHLTHEVEGGPPAPATPAIPAAAPAIQAHLVPLTEAEIFRNYGGSSAKLFRLPSGAIAKNKASGNAFGGAIVAPGLGGVQAIRQGNRTVAEYAVEFRNIAADLRYGQEAGLYTRAPFAGFTVSEQRNGGTRLRCFRAPFWHLGAHGMRPIAFAGTAGTWVDDTCTSQPRKTRRPQTARFSTPPRFCPSSSRTLELATRFKDSPGGGLYSESYTPTALSHWDIVYDTAVLLLAILLAPPVEIEGEEEYEVETILDIKRIGRGYKYLFAIHAVFGQEEKEDAIEDTDEKVSEDAITSEEGNEQDSKGAIVREEAPLLSSSSPFEGGVVVDVRGRDSLAGYHRTSANQ